MRTDKPGPVVVAFTSNNQAFPTIGPILRKAPSLIRRLNRLDADQLAIVELVAAAILRGEG